MIMGSPQADELCWLVTEDDVVEAKQLFTRVNSEFKTLGEVMRDVLEGFARRLQTQSSVSAPRWSPTPPTKDGWYWVKEGYGASIVKVEGNSVLFVEQEWPEPLASLSDALWHGPLQEPTE